MAIAIKMPQLGLTMTEGTVGKWLKAVGDEVKKGEGILEISTDKLSTTIESETDGVLLAIIAEEYTDIPVQGILGYIGEAGEKIESAAISTPANVEVQAPSMPVLTPVRMTDKRLKVSPLAKKTAEKYGVECADLIGTGPGGRIVQIDVLAAWEKKSVLATRHFSERLEKLQGIRKAVAERVTRSHAEIPCVTQITKVDVTRLIVFRENLNENREKELRFSLNEIILKAVAKALRTNPHILVSLRGDKIIYHEHVNLGMAVALDEGLIVPVIRDADKMSLSALSAAAKDLSGRARKGALAMEEYQGATFTVSNLGMFHVESFTPIINQPEAAILGIGAVQSELDMDQAGNITKKQVMRISMTYDHRLMDGAVAAKFAAVVKMLLENPVEILL